MDANPEARRRVAALFAQGWSCADVARAVGVHRSTATRWHRTWREGGAEQLAAPRARGRRPKLDLGASPGIQRALERSPREQGFDLDRWSLASVVCLVQRATGVTYHARHVSRLLRRSGWVVPPIGPGAEHAFRVLRGADPDGNELLLLRRRSERLPLE